MSVPLLRTPPTDKPVQVLERNEGFDQERAGFLSVLCKMCSLQRSVPKSMRVACGSNERKIEPHRGRTSAFRDEDRGRPVAIKVMLLYPTSDLEICPSVSSPHSMLEKIAPDPTARRGSVEKPLLGNTYDTRTFFRFSV